MCGVRLRLRLRLLPLLLLLLLHHVGAEDEHREVKVGIILDLSSPLGNMSNTCISMALDDFYANHRDYKTRLTLDVRDSRGDVLVAASEGETVVRNLTRLVLIIWVFAVLIITSSYQGSFTSMLTVPQLRATFQDIESLKNSKKPVGYQVGSFVEDVLLKNNFPNLIGLVSHEQYAEALSNGTVVAIIDEIPYVRIFLAKYCTNYTMIGPIYRTGGLSFAFAIGSPLVPDVSTAILKVIEGDKILGIDTAWFPRQTTSCPDLQRAFGSDPLTVHSFQGLFLITGVASLLAIIFFLVSLLYKRNSISRTDFEEQTSLWQTIISTVRLLHQKNQISSPSNLRPTSRDSISFKAIEDTTDSPIAGEGTSLVELVTQGRSRSQNGDASNVRRGSRFVSSLSFPFTKSNIDQYGKNE